MPPPIAHYHGKELLRIPDSESRSSRYRRTIVPFFSPQLDLISPQKNNKSSRSN
jgi:hypothetical protein